MIKAQWEIFCDWALKTKYKCLVWYWGQCWLPQHWYHEYKDHVRMHDYFNIMINNFPILTWRRLDFGLHEEELTEIHLIGFLGYKIYSWNKTY